MSLTARCESCTIVSDMPVVEPTEGVLILRCRYCGQEQTETEFDTLPHTSYSERTPSEGATNA